MHGKIVGLVRDEYLEVPAEALREVVLNALCHRQYERYNLTIGIAIYDDCIEIENPGILPPQITPENILQSHISYPYNPLIANVLYSTTDIENWGSGVKRIMEACQKRGRSLAYMDCPWRLCCGDIHETNKGHYSRWHSRRQS